MAGINGGCRCKNKVTKEIARYGILEPALALELKKIGQVLSLPGRGILDIDDILQLHQPYIQSSDNPIKKLNILKIFLSKNNTNFFISGMILTPEIVQGNLRGVVVQLLQDHKIVSGVCVDMGRVPLSTLNETTTQGLDGLQEKCIELKQNGFHFTTWKCYCKISSFWPSKLAVIENTNVLARYAGIVQSTRMLPIIDLEILSDGDDSINHSQRVHQEILSSLVKTLIDYHVYLDGVILKISMVQPGSKNAAHIEPEMIAEYTFQVLRHTIPPAIPSIIFKSDKQSTNNYLLNINAISKIQDNNSWIFAFCFDNFLSKNLEYQRETVENSLNWIIKYLELFSKASVGKLNMEELKQIKL